MDGEQGFYGLYGAQQLIRLHEQALGLTMLPVPKSSQRQMTMYLADGGRLLRRAYGLDCDSERNYRLRHSLTLR